MIGKERKRLASLSSSLNGNDDNGNSNRNICVIVLGDIGRSPRMQYHVLSLLQHKFNVDLIGYYETPPMQEICQDPQIHIQKLGPFPDLNLPRLLKYIFKTLWQLLSLFIALFSIRRPDTIICQNPPGIPTLFVCYVYCLLFVRCKFIIDWHNYTYTILSLKNDGGQAMEMMARGDLDQRSERRIVKIAKWFESHFGRKSAYNFCVTKAMQEDLWTKWNIKATVLYDHPPAQFQSMTLEKKHELYYKLSQDFPELLRRDHEENQFESTQFTYKDIEGNVHLRSDRPGILISSTSWTPDEDFSILLNALEIYEDTAHRQPGRYPHIICIITGKGPQKTYYLDLIEQNNWKYVTIITPWLSNEDYPQCLASADLGVSLHYSSSGLDLPMKIVDMFGCGLPVCAINYKCLGELVQHGKNGFVFDTHLELSQQILTWFCDFPSNITLVNVKETISHRLKEFQQSRWNENWNEYALPVFLK